jgi:hypothetical protein
MSSQRSKSPQKPEKRAIASDDGTPVDVQSQADRKGSPDVRVDIGVDDSQTFDADGGSAPEPERAGRYAAASVRGPLEEPLPAAPLDRRFQLPGLSARLSTALYGLYEALNLESLPESTTQDEDHEAYGRRMKQLRLAAQIVLGLWEALKKGPHVSLAVPLSWALDETGGPFVPAHPKKKLSVAKDYLIQTTEDTVLHFAPAPDPATGEPGYATDVERRSAAEGALAVEADRLRLGEASQDKSSVLYRFAFFIAVSLWDPHVSVIRSLLPLQDLAATTLNIAQTLTTFDKEKFADTQLLLRRVLQGLGLPRDEAHEFFSYQNKRDKRAT